MSLFIEQSNMRAYGRAILNKEFQSIYNIKKIHLMPSMIAGHKLHYVIDASFHSVVGEIDILFNRNTIISTFERIDSVKMEYILKSRAAYYFRDFTPIFHVSLEKVGVGYKAILTDLRYLLKNKYLHHATITYDDKMYIVEEKFHPYSIDNKLDI